MINKNLVWVIWHMLNAKIENTREQDSAQQKKLKGLYFQANKKDGNSDE